MLVGFLPKKLVEVSLAKRLETASMAVSKGKESPSTYTLILNIKLYFLKLNATLAKKLIGYFFQSVLSKLMCFLLPYAF